MTQAQTVTRRSALALIVVALVLALAAAYTANAYLTGEARKVAAPIRAVWVASRDIAAGTLVGAGDVTAASMPLADDLKDFFVSADGQPTGPLGVSAMTLRKGQPLQNGALLPPQSASSVAPLLPLQVSISGTSRPVVGGLNIPVDRLVAPPPAFAEHDHVDLWAFVPGTTPTSGTTQLVLGDLEVIAFVVGGQRPEGIVIAATFEQIDRALASLSSGAQLLLTVRPSPRR